MHNAPRITECPHCNTAFRVSDAQLRAAKGAVRCGSCLEVFLAHQHWLSEEDQLDDNDELTIDEWGDDPNAIFAELEQLDRDLESSLDDESWALRLLEEEEKADQLAEQKKAEQIKSEQQKSNTHHAESAPVAAIIEPAFVVLNDHQDSDDSTAEVNTENYDAIDNHEAIASHDVIDKNLTNDTDEMSFSTEPQIGNDVDWEDFDRSDKEIDALYARKIAKKPASNILSYLVIVIGLLGFGAQYISTHFNELSQDAQWRPLLQTACATLSCTIPEWRDFNAIQQNDLIVRSHPQQRDALLINVQLKNASAFPQAFPLLELSFSDINGAPIATRRFKPEEYLAGELSGLRLMPTQQAIQIELALVDPGKAAVNYQLKLIGNN
jgi:predicted Zn finger-like uncharacterized protein